MEARTRLAPAIDASRGFCDLGMYADAWEELEKLGPEERRALLSNPGRAAQRTSMQALFSSTPSPRPWLSFLRNLEQLGLSPGILAPGDRGADTLDGFRLHRTRGVAPLPANVGENCGQQ
jgi:hypothetical protein